MAKHITEEVRGAIVSRIRAGEADLVIARDLGVNRKTVAATRRKIGAEPLARNVTAASALRLDASPEARRTLALTDEIARLKRELKNALRERDLDDMLLGVIGDIANAPSNPPAWLTQAPKKARGGKDCEVPVLTFADWHCGEKVSLTETNGVNEYSLEIADRRIKRLLDTTVDLCRNHHSKQYPGIVLNLAGDFISGALHPELAKSDELEILPTVLWVLDRLEAAILRLADEFGRVFVSCSGGNHGRNTQRPEFKGYVYKNFDWLIYRLLARRFAGDKRIVFQIDDSNMGFYRVFNTRFMLVHGDQMGVKGGDGIIGAIGPIMRGEIKVRGQQSTIGRGFDYLILGHWHQMLWLPRAIVANSLKGFDEYAQNALRAVPSTPSQPLFFVHPKWGITSRWEVYVESTEKDQSAPWVSVLAA